MGGSSKSSSSQTTTSTTKVNDSRVGVEAGGIGVGSNGTLTLTTTDFGLIQKGGDAIIQGLNTVSGLGKGALDAAVKIIVNSNAAMVQKQQSVGQDLAKYYVKAVSIVIVLVTISLAFMRFKGSKK